MNPTILQPARPLNPRDITSTGTDVGPTTDTGSGGVGVDRDAQLRRAVGQAAHLRRGFYLVVLLVALAGQVSGATESLHLRPLAAIPAVAALELGGMVVLSNADVRRQLGERAIGSRILSAAIAAGAVWFNAAAHDDHLVGGFFAGMSALGYLVWLTHSENTRRDRLRATGDLPPTTPAYELFGHWLRHPLLTQRARSLAKADPTLGLYASITAARERREREHRRNAIAAVLKRKIHAAVDRDTAALAIAVYDLDEIARRLAARADYTTLSDLIAADLQPDQLTGNPSPAFAATRVGPTSAPPPADSRPDSATFAETTGKAALSTTRAPSTAVTGAAWTTRTRLTRTHATRSTTTAHEVADASSAPTDGSDSGATTITAGPDDSSGEGGRPGASDDSAKFSNSVPPSTAAAVAYWHRQDPTLHPAQIGERIGRSERTVRRYWPPRPDVNSRGITTWPK